MFIHSRWVMPDSSGLSSMVDGLRRAHSPSATIERAATIQADTMIRFPMLASIGLVSTGFVPQRNSAPSLRRWGAFCVPVLSVVRCGGLGCAVTAEGA